MILSAASAFVLVLAKDPMSDAMTHEARLGNDRTGISVMCGAATGGKLAVEFRAGRTLYEYIGSKASVEWRFDEGAPAKAWGIWDGREAVLTGAEAEAFARGAADAVRLRARFAALTDGDIVMDTPLGGSSEAIGAVLSACGMK